MWVRPTGLNLGCVLRLMVLPFSLLRRVRQQGRTSASNYEGVKLACY